MLAVQMGLSHKVPKLDVGAGSYSQTARLLDEWANDTSSTIGKYKAEGGRKLIFEETCLFYQEN